MILWIVKCAMANPGSHEIDGKRYIWASHEKWICERQVEHDKGSCGILPVFAMEIDHEELERNILIANKSNHSRERYTGYAIYGSADELLSKVEIPEFTSQKNWEAS